MPDSRFFYVTYKSFNTIRENKILAKISEFTVRVEELTSAQVTRNKPRLKRNEDFVYSNVIIDMLIDAIQHSITFPAWHGRDMSSFWEIGEALTSFHE